MSQQSIQAVDLESIESLLLKILQEQAEGMPATDLVDKANEEINNRPHVQRAIRRMLDGGKVSLGRSMNIEAA